MNDKIEKRAVIETCVYTKRARKTDIDIPEFLSVFPNISIEISAIEGYPCEADVEYYVPEDDLTAYENFLKSLNELTAVIENTALAGAVQSYHRLNNLNRFD